MTQQVTMDKNGNAQLTMDEGQLTPNCQLSTVNSQLKKKPVCPKCSGPLRRDTVTMISDGAGYAVEDEIKCDICGWRVARQAETYFARYRDIPLESVRGVAVTRGNTGKRQLTNPRPTNDCCVEGCTGKHVYYSHSRMCGPCGRKQSKWLNGPQTNPPPFVPHSFLKGMLEPNPLLTERSMSHVASNY